MTDQKTLKKKKPNFYRQDAHKKPKLGFKWRKPKGSDSKMRRNLKGYRKSPDTGYGSAKVFRGLHPSGLTMLVVNQISQLQGIDPKVTGILLSATLGQRKRVDIVKEAEKNKITILNVKDPAAYLKAVEEDMKNRKEKKEAIAKSKEKAEEKKKKAAEKKKKEEKEAKAKDSIEEAVADEEKKIEKKKEQDKVLTKKE